MIRTLVTSLAIIATSLIAAHPMALPAMTPTPGNSMSDTGYTQDQSTNISAKHFTIANLSHYTLTLTAIYGQWPDDELMPLGTILAPGQTHPFGVTVHLFGTNGFRTALFSVVEPSSGYRLGTFTVQMKPASQDINEPLAKASYSGLGDLEPASADLDVQLFDAPGTVIEVPAEDHEAQEDTLRQFCENTRLGSCSFEATGYSRLLGPVHQLASFENRGADPGVMTVIQTDTVTSTDSLGIEVQAGTSFSLLAAEIDASITATYGHSWMKSQSFQVNVSHPVPAGYVGIISAEAPIERVVGKLTVTFAHTVWKLDGVEFDAPQADGAEYFSYSEHRISPSA